MKDCRGIAADCVGRKRDWGLWRKWGVLSISFHFSFASRSFCGSFATY